MKIISILLIFIGLVKILACLSGGTKISVQESLPISEDTLNKIGNGVICMESLIEILSGLFIISVI